MIYDKLSNLNKYQTKYPALNEALKLLQNFDLSTLKPGVNVITEDIKIIKKDFENYFPGKKFGELHQQHVDIHLYGGDDSEIIYFSDQNKYEEQDVLEANAAGDVVFIKIKEYENSLILKPNMFALFFPGEFHAPKIANPKLKTINKYIVKVKIK